MTKTLLSILIILISFSYQAQKITIGKIDAIKSNVLKEKRSFYVYIPPKFDGRDKNKKYPVLYLLDGETHFHSVASMVRQLATFDERFMEMVVVGIPNTNRWLNLSHESIKTFNNSPGWESRTGGGNDFELFMKDELFPYIEKKYPVTSTRTIVGHSLGGLFALHVLYQSPELFDNYITLDPSLWWKDNYLLEKSDTICSNIINKNKSLFIAIANTMPYGMNLKEGLAKQKNDHLNALRCNFDFSKKAESIINDTTIFNWKYYPKNDHGSVPFIGTFDGLNALFSWYEFKEISRFYDSTTTVQEFKIALDKHIQFVSDKIGYKYTPSAAEVSWWAELLSSEHQPYKAQAVLQLNIENFPNHTLSYSQLADSYVVTKDTSEAIKYYEKALDLGRNKHAKSQLKKLKATNKT